LYFADDISAAGRARTTRVETAVPANKGKIEIPMLRTIPVSALLFAALLFPACAEDDPPTAPTDPPTEIAEQFAGTLSRNGGITHEFSVQRAGDVSARIDALTPSEAVVGISLGPLSVQACSAAVARDDATSNTTLAGTASTTGRFCLRVYDASGSLAAPVDYSITVRHF
jgi:hypothetical protein